jgi:transcription-repair coupling factor (superfamily II helicase)
MNLSGLLPLIEGMPGYQRLINELQAAQGEKKVAVLDAAKPYLLACLYLRLGLPALVITSKPERARQLYDEIPVWCGSNDSICLFPEPDALPYERISSDPYTVKQRLKVLSRLNEAGKAPLVIASAHAVVRKIMPPAVFTSSCHTLSSGMKLDLEQILNKWISIGYKVDTKVELPGTVSRRGGIIDIYPPHSDSPARIELLGDTIESIRLFDAVSQRSIEVVPQITIIPAREMVIPPNKLGDMLRRLDLSTLNTEARNRMEEEIEGLALGKWPDSIDLYSSLVNDSGLADYLPSQAVVIIDQPDLIEAAAADLDAQATELRRSQSERGELPGNFPVPYFAWPELMNRLDRFDQRLTLEQWGDDSQAYRMSLGPAPSYGGRLPVFLKEAKSMIENKRRVIIVSQQSTRLSELLEGQDILAFPVTNIVSAFGGPPPGSVTLVQGSLSEGWTMDGPSGDILLTDVELFGFAKKLRMVPKRPVRSEAFLSDLAVGDYVVHIDHGVARFAGLTRLSLDNDTGGREYLVLEYAAGDRLYVPSEQVDRVTRYIGPGGYSPALSRLGTQEWNRAKQRVKEAADILAKELLELYSVREVLPGVAFSPDTVWQQEFEASFPYVETPDQLEAVQEVKRDMERARPMDRLVCGDVGYGKTEVALRAAFKAAMDGMQVAVLVPTTVLAQQHFTTFSQRLSAFPVKVELLSRFRSPREQQEVIQGLAKGSVDICIGTHRLLQKDVSFKNLGLVIIDEEQRFGVAHKERLKQLRKEVDVLTLSATPIPRTMHMALVGVRDMSTMETPPEERLPIKSYVAPYSERMIREAILRELERNGQVFFVHNRVQRINWVAKELEKLVPEARIGIGHGQMPEETLESVMLDFTQGKIDVLVCTTIIESGLDIPNVNTLIVDDADRLGLTQLYQLRGRVGRGTNRAYAYFFYDKGKQLTDAAEKRLRTIFEASELGAGFRVAMKDLEIRGAGNLLGPEQSGQIGAVGFELYSQLLTEAVEERRAGGKAKTTLPPISTTVDLPLPAFIPEEYVPDLNTRLSLYLRLAKVSLPGELDELEGELEDRFGPLPPEVKDLLYMVRIKLLGSGAGIESISTEDGQVVLTLVAAVAIDRQLLQHAFGSRLKIGTNRLRFDMNRAGKEWKDELEQGLKKVAQSRDGSQSPQGSESGGSR